MLSEHPANRRFARRELVARGSRDRVGLAVRDEAGDPRRVHDQLTRFCPRCGLRQAAASACVSCAAGSLADLRDDAARADALRAYRTAYVTREASALARKVPSVRRAPLAFAAGSAIVLAVPLGLPLSIVGGVAAVAGVAAASVAGGFALGSAIRAVAPHFLLGKDQRLGIDREVRELAERVLPMHVVHAPPAQATQTTMTGVLAGTPTTSPFGDEPLLAARLVGDVSGRVLDDAWIAPGEISFAGKSLEHRQVLSIAWLEVPSTTTLRPGMLSREARARLDAYLLERGVEAADDTPLTLAVVRAGDSARVRGTPLRRAISDGYRGQIEIVDLADAVIEASVPAHPAVAVPGPFVPPALEE